MSLFEKMDPSFFTILVSKNRDIYVDLLLQIHTCIYRNQTMSMERALLKDLLEDYVQDRKYEIDFREEAEYSDIEKELRQEKDVYGRDIQFLLRLFEKHTWIHVDLHMDTMKKMVSLPYHSRVFISFVNDIIKEREQIGYLIRIHASLKDMEDPVKIEDSYQHIRNAYADFKELILTLEQTNARIRDYYAIQVKKASTRIYHDFFDVYYGDIVEGYVFPTLVEDSLKRFKNPVATILEALLQEEALKEKIVDSAVSHYRVSSRDTARKHIEDMLYSMYNDLYIVETLTTQLVDSDAGYRRLAKQKIMYLCNSDQGLKGKLVELLHHMKEEPQKMCDLVSETINAQQTRYMERDEVYTFHRRTRRDEREVMTFAFEEGTQNQEELEKRIGFDRYSRFTRESISAYYAEKLKGEAYGKLKDIGVRDMDDYIRSILVYVYGRDRKMDVHATLLPNHEEGITEGNFQYPNLLIKRKETK